MGWFSGKNKYSRVHIWFNTDQTIFDMVKTKTEIWFWIMFGGLEHLAHVILLSGSTWEKKLWHLKNKNAGKWICSFQRFLLIWMCIMGFLVEVTPLFWYKPTLRLLANDRKIYKIYKWQIKGKMKVKMSKNSHKIDKKHAFWSLNDLELQIYRGHISYVHRKFIVGQYFTYI